MNKDEIMLTVNDLMTILPLVVQPSTPLSEVRYLMSLESIRQIPVLDNEKLVGIITERDLRSAEIQPIPIDISAETIMTPDPMTVTPDTPAYQAAEMLRIYKIGALPVVSDGRLVGIVTVSDFLDQFTVSDEVVRVGAI